MDELFGSLSFEEKLEKKNKGVALQFLAEEEHDGPNKDSEDSLAESISLLPKQFNRVLKWFEKNTGNILSKNNKSFGNSPKQFRTLSSKKDVKKFGSSTLQKEKTFRCRYCEGYGCFQEKRPTFL